MIACIEDGQTQLYGRRQTATKIEKAMESIRSEGFALSRDQADVGASAIAAPIWTADSVQGSVGVGVLNQRFDEVTEGDLAGDVMRAAEVISRRIGNPLSVMEGGI